MADPLEVARLLRESLAAHTLYRQMADARNRLGKKRAAETALATLQDAIALDPSRSAPAWRDGTPRDQLTLDHPMVAFYLRVIANATAAGL